MRSLNYARLEPGLTIGEWEQLILDLVDRNDHLRSPGGDFNIGQWVSRGSGYDALDQVPATVCVRLWHLQPHQWVEGYSSGVHAVIVRTKSYPPGAMEPKVKHNNRLNFALAHLEAADVDPEGYPLLTDDRGHITENISANVWVVRDGVLMTPTDRNTLQGDSQRFVFELAHRLGIPAGSEDLQPYDIYTADEAFFSNTLFCVMPIGRVDTRAFSDEVPGPITRQLQAAWSETAGLDIVDQAINYRPPSQDLQTR